MGYGKEFNFEEHPLKSFIFFDIETVAKVDELQEDTPLYDAFMYKMRYAEEAQRKDFSAYNLKALFDQKAALYPEFGKIVCISVGMVSDDRKLIMYSFKDVEEATLLDRFNRFLERKIQEDPNVVLCGVNLKFFDLRYVYIRSVIHQVKPVKKHINLSGLKPWEVWTADITDVWKQSSSYNAPLIAIAECLGLPSPKSDIDGSMVSNVYYKEGAEGLERIVKYCEADVFTTANVAMKLRFEPLLELAGENVEEDITEDKEIPILVKLYNSSELTEELKEEIKDTLSKKKILKKDIKNLERIILAHHLTKGDKVAVKKAKKAEVEQFLKTL